MTAASLALVGEVVQRSKRPDEVRLIQRLVRGEQGAWDGFVERFAPVIYGAVIKTLRRSGRDLDDSSDVAQDVFVRLCNNGYRLLRRYDPSRAALSTWLTIISTSTTIDHLRRQKPATALDDVPENIGAVEPLLRFKVRIPPGLLSPRQSLILKLLYDRDMDVADIAGKLSVDPQTVRSTHHKALIKLRAHFKPED
jgi:RNA polymerase sigma-70 factor (ECF subfamily)